MGLQASLFQFDVAWHKIDLENPGDVAFVNNLTSGVLPDAGVGIYYYTNRFYLGGALSHLIENRLGLATDLRINEAHLFRHYFVTSGVVVPVSEYVHFRPSVLFKYVQGAPADLDLNASFLFYDRLWAGVALRTSKKSGFSEIDNQC